MSTEAPAGRDWRYRASPLATSERTGCWARWLPITVKRVVWRALSWSRPPTREWFLSAVRDWARVGALGFCVSIGKADFLGGQALASGCQSLRGPLHVCGCVAPTVGQATGA